jgi:hypothetical protein
MMLQDTVPSSKPAAVCFVTFRSFFLVGNNTVRSSSVGGRLELWGEAGTIGGGFSASCSVLEEEHNKLFIHVCTQTTLIST